MLAVSTVSAGNTGDTIARIVLDQVSKQIGQSFLIENRTGAGRTIGSASVAIDPSATSAARSLTAMPAETGVHSDDWTAHACHFIHSANLSSDKREPNMTDTPEYASAEVWVWEKGDSPSWRYSNTNRPIAGATHEKELPRGKHPLQLYSLATPNGVKVTIMLEELLAAGHSGAEYDAWL